MTAITVTNGQGRPKNPYPKPTVRHEITDWHVFEQSVQYHKAPGIPEGDAEAELVWQFGGVEMSQYSKDGWMNVNESYYKVYSNFEEFSKSFKNVRAIWLIKSEKEVLNSDIEDKACKGEVNPTATSLANEMFEPTPPVSKEQNNLHDIEWDTNTLNPDNYDHEGNPYKVGVSKEEGKTVDLEEAAFNFADLHVQKQRNHPQADTIHRLWFDGLDIGCISGFKAGAQWQSDQQVSSQKAEVDRLRKALTTISEADYRFWSVTTCIETAKNALNPKNKS